MNKNFNLFQLVDTYLKSKSSLLNGFGKDPNRAVNIIEILSEHIAADVYGLELCKNRSQQGHDGICVGTKEKYQIKGRTYNPNAKNPKTSTKFDFKGLYNKDSFHYFVGIIFNPELRVHSAYLASLDSVRSIGKYKNKSNNSIQIDMTQFEDAAKLSNSGCVDITGKILAAWR